MILRKRLKWTSITESEFEWLIVRCNFTPLELQILQLRRKDTSPIAIADKLGYCETHIYRISAEIVSKIRKEQKYSDL